MSFSYDLSGTVGQMRLLIPDKNEDEPLFQDEELTAMLTIERSRLRAGVALALETLASNESLTTKYIKTEELTLDGPKVAESLLKRATYLREQAADDDAGANPDDPNDPAAGGFAIAEQVYDVFGARERLRNEWLRRG